MSLRRAALTREISAEPPSEFLIFAPGENHTSKGTYIFDAAAAQSVMAQAQKCGVDYMIDLDHLVIKPDTARTDATDARGWFRVELRADGSLWAVGVSWTLDGARRLRERTQRYVSPLFTHDDAGRIRELLNVALVAMPATFDAQPLVAASRNAPGSALHTLSLMLASQISRRTKKHGS